GCGVLRVADVGVGEETPARECFHPLRLIVPPHIVAAQIVTEDRYLLRAGLLTAHAARPQPRVSEALQLSHAEAPDTFPAPPGALDPLRLRGARRREAGASVRVGTLEELKDRSALVLPEDSRERAHDLLWIFRQGAAHPPEPGSPGDTHPVLR